MQKRKRIEKDQGIQLYQRRLQKIQSMNLTSDLFASVVFEDRSAVQDVLRIITGIRNLVVKQVISQKSHRNLYGHGVVLDVWAEDSSGRQYNMELQMSEDEDHLRRSRYIQALIDSRSFDTGNKYDRLPELYLIFITKKDFLCVQTGMAEVVRIIRGTDRVVENGVHERYVNLEYPVADDELNRLLTYVRDTEGEVSATGFENLMNRVNYLKRESRGVKDMCMILEEEWQDGHKEGRKAERKECVELVQILGKQLADAGRMDDLARAMSDKEFCLGLLREFGVENTRLSSTKAEGSI